MRQALANAHIIFCHSYRRSILLTLSSQLLSRLVVHSIAPFMFFSVLNEIRPSRDCPSRDCPSRQLVQFECTSQGHYELPHILLAVVVTILYQGHR